MEDFDDYVRTRGRALWRAAFLLTGDAHEAEDLVQAALAKTYLRFDELGERYDAYLRTTMYRTYCSWWRRLWRGERPTERLPEAPSADPAAESRVDSLRAPHELEGLTDAQVAELRSAGVVSVEQMGKVIALGGPSPSGSPSPKR